jgi:hypothetical protein
MVKVNEFIKLMFPILNFQQGGSKEGKEKSIFDLYIKLKEYFFFFLKVATIDDVIFKILLIFLGNE